MSYVTCMCCVSLIAIGKVRCGLSAVQGVYVGIEVETWRLGSGYSSLTCSVLRSKEVTHKAGVSYVACMLCTSVIAINKALCGFSGVQGA